LTDEMESDFKDRSSMFNEEALEILVSAEADLKRKKQKMAESLEGIDEDEKKDLLN
jgi:hypothetical protein